MKIHIRLLVIAAIICSLSLNIENAIAQVLVDSTFELNGDSVDGPNVSDEDAYGSAIAPLGDLNLSGAEDIAVGSRFSDVGGPNRGEVHISFLGLSGSVLSTVSINSSTTNGPVLSDQDLYGASVAAIGDLDGDGITELAVGAPQDAGLGTNRGAVHISFMNRNGSVKSTVIIDDATTNGPMLPNGSFFGVSVVGLGDLDGDSVEDIAVGAPGRSSSTVTSGSVFILFLNTDGSVKSTEIINNDTTNGPTLSNAEFYGLSVASIGDINNDGIGDLAVGAPQDSGEGANKGSVHISFLDTDGSVKGTVEIDDSTSGGPSIEVSDFFGSSVAALSDIDGDGFEDIVVGSAGVDVGGSNSGGVYLLLLDASAEILDTIPINSSTVNGPTLNAGDAYGSSVQLIGDLENNGSLEIAVGAIQDMNGPTLPPVPRGTVHISSLSLPPLAQAEIDISGNSRSIENEDSTPSAEDGTDLGFGVQNTVSPSSTFTIRNIGTNPLTLTGSPRVELTGSQRADFSIVSQPSDTVSAGGSVNFQVVFSPRALGLRKARVTVASNDSDESVYSFVVQGRGSIDTDGDLNPDPTDNDDDDDGLSDIDEDIAGTDPLIQDTDGDGVNDFLEIEDGTNPLDSGSFLESLGDEVCVEWNGFLGFLSQIFEIRNASASDIEIELSLFDIAGTVQTNFVFGLNPGIQRDIIINDLGGFIPDSYGLVCAKTRKGGDDAVAGQLSVYRFTGASYSLAAASSFLSFRAGNQYLTYNTFQPSVNPVDQTNFVANWAQIINLENNVQTGTLRFYDIEGNEVLSQELFLLAKQRKDLEIHVVGTFKTGLVAWEPDSPTAKFGLRENRYYYGASGVSDLADSVSISGARGTGQKLVSSFDTQGRIVTLEISNTSDKTTIVRTQVRDGAGALVPNQPPNLQIAPKASQGIVLNTYLASGVGNVEVTSSEVGSAIVNLVEYGRSAGGSLQYANPSILSEPLAEVLTGSYNSFLSQSCRTRIANASGSLVTARVSMTRFDGTRLVREEALSVPANGAAEFDLCVRENQQAYGEVRVLSPESGILTADVVRRNSEGTVEFSSPMRPQ